MDKRWIVVLLAVTVVFLGIRGEGKEATPTVPSFSSPETTVPVTSESKETVEFPYVLRGTGLIAEHLAQYEGEFLENDSREPVSGVAALMVYNPGSHGVYQVTVQLLQGDAILTFEIACLPPHSRVLVLERDARPYSRADVTACECLSFSADDFALREDRVELREEDGRIVLKNTSGETLTGLAVVYKQFAPKGKFYLGGAAKRCEIGILQPGESMAVMPYGYVFGYSHVLAVEFEQEKAAAEQPPF